MKKSTVKFDAAALKKQMYDNLVEEQTRRLIAYAEEKIKEIGDKMQTWGSRYHMDRTGHLLNSLCWGVAYSGELKASGFYRDEVIHSERGSDRDGQSYLHEWGSEGYKYAYPVNGRALAQDYIRRYGKVSWNGKWRVFFAVLAPYWGYWESGFSLKGKRLQFTVMSQFYDAVTKDLKPATTSIKIKVPTYHKSYGSGKTRSKSTFEKVYLRRVDNPRYKR